MHYANMLTFNLTELSPVRGELEKDIILKVTKKHFQSPLQMY
jgi:hypothetical protein